MLDQDPFEVLGVPQTASEAEIRARYLQLVRENPPDRAPEQFAAIRAAYDDVRDPVVRIHNLLFETRSKDSLDNISQDLLRDLKQMRPPMSVLLHMAEG